MIISAVFSKPSRQPSQDPAVALERPYIKIRIRKNPQALKGRAPYQGEFFTEKQCFTKNMSEKDVEEFIENHAGTSFKNCIVTTESEEKTILANKKGQVRTLVKKTESSGNLNSIQQGQKKKNYIIEEGTAIPFMEELGVFTKEGKIVSRRYDKFRQINRFLEFIDDILEDVRRIAADGTDFTEERPLRIIDFGSGKSYLTFAVYYFLVELRHIPVQITGLDLKEDVIRNCQALAEKSGYRNLNFKIGDIAEYEGSQNPDIIITLHACDTATDYALDYAVKRGAAAILSVPCCQHEINSQIGKSTVAPEDVLAPIMKYGILRERFAALATDAVRAELLESRGYSVQLLEFIDMEGTPKNLLIRAVLRKGEKNLNSACKKRSPILEHLKVHQTLDTIL